MGMTLLVGGARAGKSSLAARFAQETGLAVTFIATAVAGDAEMERRIARHRAERPPHWTTVEEPAELGSALERVSTDATVIVDCLTLWVSNLVFENREDHEIERIASAVAEEAATRSGSTFVVTNEVGSGVHPNSELGRRFRDLLGRVNGIWSQHATDVYLVVAGRTLRLDPVSPA